MIETNYPFCHTLCEQPRLCQLYQFIRNVYDPKADSAYTPIEKRVVEVIYTDSTMKSVDDMMTLLYGRHVCTIKEIRQCQVNRDEYKKMKDSYNVDTLDFLYEFCKHRWFRLLFSAIPDVKKDIVVSSWRKAQELGVMHKYFGLLNVLDIPLAPDTDVQVVINYADDYEEFARQMLGETLYCQQIAIYNQVNDVDVIRSQMLDGKDEFREIPQLVVIADVILEERLRTNDAVDLNVLDYQRDQMSAYLKKRITNIPHLENSGVIRVVFENDHIANCGESMILVTRDPRNYGYMRSVYRNPYYFNFNYEKIGVSSAVGSNVSLSCSIANKCNPEEIGSLVAFSKYRENYEKYLIARKINGQRSVMVFLEGFVTLIKRNGSLGVFAAVYAKVLEQTACDVEVYGDVVYVLDVFFYRGKDCTQMSFSDRMVLRLKIIGAVKYVSRYRLAVQQYLLPQNFQYLCHMVDHKISDGVVFFPIERYGGRVRLKIFKWKPTGDTVDFKVISRDGEKWLCVMGDQKVMVPIEQVMIDDFYTSRIVECYRENGSWVFYKVRHDKTYPNSVRTYNDVLQFSQKDQMEKFFEAMVVWINTSK